MAKISPSRRPVTKPVTNKALNSSGRASSSEAYWSSVRNPLRIICLFDQWEVLIFLLEVESSGRGMWPFALRHAYARSGCSLARDEQTTVASHQENQE